MASPSQPKRSKRTAGENGKASALQKLLALLEGWINEEEEQEEF